MNTFSSSELHGYSGNFSIRFWRQDVSLFTSIATIVSLLLTIGKIRVILWTIAAIVPSIAKGKILLWQDDPHFAYRF